MNSKGKLAINSKCFFSIHLFLQFHHEEIEDLPEVLADKVVLLPEILRRSRADNTCRKYESGFLRWKKWAECNGVGSRYILPAQVLPVALYLVSLIQTASTASPVITAFYAIKWFHEICGMKSPTDSDTVVNVLESAKRILAKPTNKKEPISIDILMAVFKRLYQEKNLKNQRVICACLLGYSGFMRSSELLNIKVSDIVFDQNYMAIFIESSKTDKYRDGSWIMIAKTGTCLCPVTNVKKYIEWANLSSEDFLFCNLSKIRCGYKVRSDHKVMSYTNLREEFLAALSPHVTDISKYCLHSLRSGGASAAANNGVQDRMFKRHGRWVSDSAKDGYIKDNLKERLAVSLSLGL